MHPVVARASGGPSDVALLSVSEASAFRVAGRSRVLARRAVRVGE
jgi:hypothetical protein